MNIELFEGKEKDAKFWRRLRTCSRKSEIMNELIRLRLLQIEDKLSDSDGTYYKRLVKAVSAEFSFVDSRIQAQKVIGERREDDRKARDRRKILIGAYVEKMLSEADKTGKPGFLRPWLTNGLNDYLDKADDRRLFDDLLVPNVTEESDYI